jgi:DNA replication protein DnaC
MTIDTIRDQLKNLKLTHAASELETIVSKRKTTTEIKWLSELLEVEINARKSNAIERRIKKAEFPERKCIEQFDWNFNKKLPQEEIKSLHNLEFIKANEIALFLGNTGTGKSHCALSIGMKAASQGISVYCSSVKRLATKIKLAKERNTLDQLFKKILTSKLWILDDWGVVSMTREIGEEVFDLFDQRKHNSAMILTSNRDVDEWPKVFSEPILASAAIDRMFECAHICIFEGPSYRMKGKIIFDEIDNGKD